MAVELLNVSPSWRTEFIYSDISQYYYFSFAFHYMTLQSFNTLKKLILHAVIKTHKFYFWLFFNLFTGVPCLKKITVLKLVQEYQKKSAYIFFRNKNWMNQSRALFLWCKMREEKLSGWINLKRVFSRKQKVKFKVKVV